MLKPPRRKRDSPASAEPRRVTPKAQNLRKIITPRIDSSARRSYSHAQIADLVAYANPRTVEALESLRSALCCVPGLPLEQFACLCPVERGPRPRSLPSGSSAMMVAAPAADKLLFVLSADPRWGRGRKTSTSHRRFGGHRIL